MLSSLKYAARSLAKTPWLTAVVVITLALGIAANTAVFSWTRGVLLNPFHGVADGQRLVSLETVNPTGDHGGSSYPDFRDFRDSSRSLAGAIAFQQEHLTLENGTEAERVWAEVVSGNFFDVLGVRPAAGRFFRAEEQEEAVGKHPVAVISAQFWRRHFHADSEVIGKTIRVNRQELTVVGVASTEFLGIETGLSFDLWVPLAMDPLLGQGPNRFQDRGIRGLTLLARLRPGVSLPEARTEVQTIARRLAQSYPKSNAGYGATLVPIDQMYWGLQASIGTLLKTLLGAGAVLLLIVCANVANLMLVRATTRQKEFSIRLALGAARRRVIGQLLMESLLLAGLGGLAGAALAGQMGSWLRFFIPANHFPLALDFPPDSAVLLFTLSISVLVGLLFGLAPALQTIRDGQLSGLKDGGRGSGSRRSHRLRGILVVSEVALALVVLIGASLFVESFWQAKRTDPGFDPSQVLLAGINLTEQGYNTEEGVLFMRHLRDRIETLPGVRAVSFANDLPLGFSDGPRDAVQVGGYVPRRGEDMRVSWNPIWPGYFDLMRIARIEGRDFAERDDSQAPPVAIINETFARRFLPGQEPVGRRLNLGGSAVTVVGVVKDIKYRSFGETPRPYFYRPMQQAWGPSTGIVLHVRTVGPQLQLLPELRRELRSVDPGVHLFEVVTLSDYIGEARFTQKIGAALLGVLGALALLLAALGLFSVMAYSVSQRTQEIGIRMALGAQTSDVFRPVLGQALRLAMVGVGIGLALSFALTRLVASQLLGVSATDPLTFVGASCLLCAVALAASVIPARRAAKVDPLIALREE
ncbi:MAG TPA: ABC transporter permease [Steroidobacteraceae bacterium]|jgi:predicted permease